MSLRAAALVVALVGLGGQAAADPIHFEPLGLYCGFVDEVGVLSCDETTPIMWPPGADGALTMVEHHSNFRVRSQAHAGVHGAANNDIIQPQIPFSEGVAFASALVVEDTLWVFGTNDVEMNGGVPRTQVLTFWSNDPKLGTTSWKAATVLDLPQDWTAFNTSPTKGIVNGLPAYVLAVELGSPSVLVGVPFTSTFAVCFKCAISNDLSSGWEVLDPATHVYTKGQYSACPTLRYFNGYFYMTTLFMNVVNPAGPHCNSDSTVWAGCLASHVVRSKDLQTWEESAFNGGLIMGLPDGKNLSGPDHHIIPGSLLDTNGTSTAKGWAQNMTDDVNRSDMDMVDLPDGTTYVVWGTGNQGQPTAPNPSIGFNGAGIVNATQQEWLESYFS